MSAVDSKRGREQTIMVGNVRVDVQALMSIQHCCLPGVFKGPNRPFVLSEYSLNELELETIVGFLPLVEKYTASIGSVQEYDNIFDEAEDGCFIIDVDENEKCVFAYSTATGEAFLVFP